MTSTVQRRNARNRRAGQEWERELRDGFRDEGFDIEALRLAGAEDEGDMVIRLDGAPWYTKPGMRPQRLIIEAKNAKWEPGVFVSEALGEAGNYATHRNLDRGEVLGISIIKRRNKGWKDAYVLTTVREFFGLD